MEVFDTVIRETGDFYFEHKSLDLLNQKSYKNVCLTLINKYSGLKKSVIALCNIENNLQSCKYRKRRLQLHVK